MSPVLSGNGQDILSLTVPPGSYVIHVKMDMGNNDSDSQVVTCRLSTGDRAEVTVDSFPINTTPIALLDAATFNDTTPITAHCQGFNNQAFDAVMTAIRVGTLH